jgi:hypothetical protein
VFAISKKRVFDEKVKSQFPPSRRVRPDDGSDEAKNSKAEAWDQYKGGVDVLSRVVHLSDRRQVALARLNFRHLPVMLAGNIHRLNHGNHVNHG